MRRINLSDETQGRAPFKVPENYFEDFESRIMSRIDTIEDNPTQAIPKVTLFQRVKPYIYLAAMISGLAFSVHFYKSFIEPETVRVQALSDLSDEDMEQYLDDVCDYTLISNDDIYHYIASLDEDDE